MGRSYGWALADVQPRLVYSSRCALAHDSYRAVVIPSRWIAHKLPPWPVVPIITAVTRYEHEDAIRETVLSAPRFTIEKRVFAHGGGEPITRYTVVHPGAVVILPLINADSVVMIRQWRQGVEEELWELPAGTLEPGEKPIHAARRELEEETGHRARDIVPLGRFFTSPGICTEVMYAFVAEGLVETGQNLDQGEVIGPEVLSWERLKQMIIGGDIRDGKTLAVLGQYCLTSRQDT